MFSLLLIVILILLCTTSSKSLRIFYNLLIQSNEFSLNKITYDNQLKLLVSTFFLLQKDANVKKRKRKKESREPESNQWPKDYSFDTSTVFRSTNWAIAGSFCLSEKCLLNSLTNQSCITQKKIYCRRWGRWEIHWLNRINNFASQQENSTLKK